VDAADLDRTVDGIDSHQRRHADGAAAREIDDGVEQRVAVEPLDPELPCPSARRRVPPG